MQLAEPANRMRSLQRMADTSPTPDSRLLSQMPSGSEAVVVGFAEGSTHDRRKLMTMGVLPGVLVRVIQRHPSFVLCAGNTQLALDRETASLIRVRPCG